MPSNQQGFIISHPSYQQDHIAELTPEQKEQIKAQEDFRRAVAEANRQRINGGEVKTFFQELPFIVETPSTTFTERSGEDIFEQYPLNGGPSLQQTSSSSNFELLRVPESELNLRNTIENLNPVEEIQTQQHFDAQKFREQAENARYSFKAAVADSVNDNTQIRQETRDGLKLRGLYSYSDGYFRRTVHYVADEHGYRVVK